MIYVLNFREHTFRSCDCNEQAVAEIIRLRDAGVDDEEIEIINCFSGDVRYTPEEFLDDFESIEPDVED